MRKSVPFLGLLTLVIIGCNSSEQTNQDHAANYSLEIVDSLQIDYLGDLWIMDYDSSSQRYLAWGNGDREVLVLNEIGGISSTFNFPTDGPDALPGWINPIGLNNGGIEFMTAPNGFYSYDLEGNRVWSYKTSFEFYYLNGIKGDPFYSLGEDIAFLRPEKGELDWDNLADLIKNLYKSPILEVLDTASHTSRFTMPFPPNSIYNDGDYHFWTFPTVVRSGSEWILYFRNELKFWVYQEKEGEVLFQKEVSLDVPDAILEKGVPFENAEDYNELTEYSFPGSIQEIYPTEDKILVIYHKGVSEDQARQFDRNSPEGRREIEWLKKRYLAVFDLNFNQLQKDIPVPQGLIFTTILRENGEVLALKHQDFFESEDDYVIYYKLKLKEIAEN
jgi:hypothetical protein